MCVYWVYPVMSKSRKQMPNRLKRAETNDVLIGSNGVLYHVSVYTVTVSYRRSTWIRDQESYILAIFVSLFNIVFDSGCIPESWSEGSIVPIYKNKGDPANADNYRGITVLICFGKLFTCILNNRLNSYLENYNVLCEKQAGFRK